MTNFRFTNLIYFISFVLFNITFYSCDLLVENPGNKDYTSITNITVKKIYTTSIDGSNIKFIGYGGNAQFSPDGNKIYLGNLNTINTDGTGLQPLLPQNFSVWDYSISDDGKFIVFSTFHDLYIMHFDGNGLVHLLSSNNSDFYTMPCISPNDSLIVFEHNYRLSTINADGSNLKTYFTFDSTEETFIPVFADNGNKLVFVRSSSGFSASIEYYNMNPPFGITIYVYQGNTDITSGLEYIRVSPKGFAIFSGSKNAINQTMYIHKIDLNTFKDASLTDGYDVSISKDWTKFVYTKPNDPNKGIYIYSLNGDLNSNSVISLKNNFSWATIQHPKFSPDGNLILFEADSTYQVKTKYY